MRRREVLGIVCATTAAYLLPRSAIAAPVETDRLGTGRYARLTALLEKTVFEFDVLDLEVRVDASTADALGRAVRGKKYSPALEPQLVGIALGASDAYAALKFLRDFPRDEFVRGIQTELQHAYEAGLIDKEQYLRVHRGLPEWFAFLGDRGIKDGDWLYERAKPEELRSVFLDREGTKRMDVKLDGAGSTRVLLASYMAPGGDLRGPLIRSLFDS